MASGMYSFGIAELMAGGIDVVNDTLAAVLVSTAYTPLLNSDEYQTAIPDAALLDEVDLTGQEIDGTAFKADAVTFSDVDSGETCGGVVIVKNTGDTSTSVLLAYVEATPFSTDGTSVVINWDTDGIFEL